VTSPPEKEKANEANEALLAESLRAKWSCGSLIAGAISRKRRFLVEGLELAGVFARVAAIVPKSK
jgi:uncharacterized protein YggU (UPF0235/DUF167 family)